MEGEKVLLSQRQLQRWHVMGLVEGWKDYLGKWFSISLSTPFPPFIPQFLGMEPADGRLTLEVGAVKHHPAVQFSNEPTPE